MKNCLVLLTKVFPFDKGEEFIEDEIPMLSKAFEKIILIATSTADDAMQTRNTPENFEIHRIQASKIKRKIPVNAIKVFPCLNKKNIKQDECAEIKGSMKKKAYLTYFTAKANSVFEESLKILDSYDFSEYDGITFYSYWFYDTALAITKLKERYRDKNIKRIVSRAHRYDLYADKNSMNYIPLRSYLLEKLDAVYPCSENGSDYLRKLYPKYSDKVKTKYLGTRDYGVAATENNGVFHIVSCCHVSPVKRIDLLAESLYTLHDSGLKLKWTHFGDGDGLEEIKSYAKEKLEFMEVNFAGSIRNEELMEYYKNNSVNLFVNTSSSEGLPVSIMEVCSFGIPSIATDVGGTAEIVRNGETGFLLNVDFKPEGCGNKIKFMVELSDQEKQAFRDRCRKLWLENFCAERNFESFSKEIQPL